MYHILGNEQINGKQMCVESVHKLIGILMTRDRRIKNININCKEKTILCNKVTLHLEQIKAILVWKQYPG